MLGDFSWLYYLSFLLQIFLLYFEVAQEQSTLNTKYRFSIYTTIPHFDLPNSKCLSVHPELQLSNLFSDLCFFYRHCCPIKFLLTMSDINGHPSSNRNLSRFIFTTLIVGICISRKVFWINNQIQLTQMIMIKSCLKFGQQKLLK
jgi:hypothetical protein